MLESIALDSTRLQRLQQTPLWDFALSLYARPGVEAACLTLQEEGGQDVCEVLFHCWLYASGLEALPGAVARQREQRLQWQGRVTEVLRALRRDLKASATTSQSVTALRDTIKQAELMAERENLQRWQTWVYESDGSEQRVINIVENPQNSAIWLRNQLLNLKNERHSGSRLNDQAALLQALQTLTCQLDPRQGAR
ncbi:TIGR02444 family protein [Vreelandella sp. V005]|uniref:TIGR02444 family protein n=1 Tax=Vreelandella sp. V005 TaxID=3459608 RepID=UPI0040449A3D